MGRLIIVWCAMLLVSPATAHQYHRALSTLSCNENTGTFEVIHRLFTHDLDVAMGDPGDDARLEAYVADRFALRSGDDQKIALNWVGSEVRGDMVWTYQEASVSNVPKTITIINALLFSAVSEQVNRVNVECGGPVQTLVFDQPGAQSLTLAP